MRKKCRIIKSYIGGTRLALFSWLDGLVVKTTNHEAYVPEGYVVYSEAQKLD